MRRKTPESGVLKACQDLLAYMRIPCYRMQAGNIVLPNANGGHRRIKLNPEGTPDLLCYPEVTKWEGGYLDLGRKIVWIEVKKPGGIPTKEQLAFADAARNRGETWLLVDDVAILQKWIAENGAR